MKRKDIQSAREHLPLERFFLDREEAVLLIVDVQEKLAAAMEREVREKIVFNISRISQAAEVLSVPAVLTEQYPKGLGPTVDAVKASMPQYGQSKNPIEKITFDCCEEPSFMPSLADRKKVILAGMETHICVLQTCLGLLGRGLAVHVVSDACCSRKKEHHKTAIEFMRDAGAVITSVETVLFQLARRAGTDEFKAISRLIK